MGGEGGVRVGRKWYWEKWEEKMEMEREFGMWFLVFSFILDYFLRLGVFKCIFAFYF